jgi:hypothetical protein
MEPGARRYASLRSETSASMANTARGNWCWRRETDWGWCRGFELGSTRRRWRLPPSSTGFWLEMAGIGLGTGSLLSGALCALVPRIGITARIAGEERELTAGLPGYRAYARGKARLIPLVG